MKKYIIFISLFLLSGLSLNAQYIQGGKYIIREKDGEEVEHEVVFDFSNLQEDYQNAESLARGGAICFFSSLAIDGLGTTLLCVAPASKNSELCGIIGGCTLGLGTILGIVGIVNWCDGARKKGEINAAINRVILTF